MSSEEQTKTNDSEIMITIESMHKWFGDFHVLKDINLEVKRGAKIVICGPMKLEKKFVTYTCVNALHGNRITFANRSRQFNHISIGSRHRVPPKNP